MWMATHEPGRIATMAGPIMRSTRRNSTSRKTWTKTSNDVRVPNAFTSSTPLNGPRSMLRNGAATSANPTPVMRCVEAPRKVAPPSAARAHRYSASGIRSRATASITFSSRAIPLTDQGDGHEVLLRLPCQRLPHIFVARSKAFHCHQHNSISCGITGHIAAPPSCHSLRCPRSEGTPPQLLDRPTYLFHGHTPFRLKTLLGVIPVYMTIRSKFRNLHERQRLAFRDN